MTDPALAGESGSRSLARAARRPLRRESASARGVLTRVATPMSRVLTSVLVSLPLVAIGCAVSSSPTQQPTCTGGKCDGEGSDGVDNDVPLDPAPAQDALSANAHAASVTPPADGYDLISDDLVWLQSPPKSQGGRNLCTVFALTGLMEYLAIANYVDLEPNYSEQYLFWLAQTSFAQQEGTHEDTGYSTSAANVPAAQQIGVTSADAWAYDAHYWSPADGHPECTGSTQPVSCYTDGDAPQAALDATKYQLSGTLSGIKKEDIKAWLATHDTPVMASTTIYCQAWNLSCSTASSLDYYTNGWITYPNPGDTIGGGHEFLIVGWDDDLAIPLRDSSGNPLYEADGVTPQVETGFFIFKNSWTAKGFGRDNLYGAGYGLISQRYITDFPGSAAVLDDDATIVVA